MSLSFDDLNREIVACEACPRLRGWCQNVAAVKRKSFADEEYWGRPVPNFGDPHARGLIVGLAPAAHGANRTGRMFTGDRSGDWLFEALHRVGLASQPGSSHADDGLALHNVMITATCHCAPPDNKPTPLEISNCLPFLQQTFALRDFQSVLCLGSIAWTSVHRLLGHRPLPSFGHGAESTSQTGMTILGCYHPSQQNTFTGRLTMDMLVTVMQRFADSVSTTRLR